MADESTRVIIRATDESKAAFDSALTNLNALKGSAASLSGVIAGVTAALGSLTVVAKFTEFVKGAAALDDMAEKTGGSVEKLSALAGVAKISGVAIESVEGGLIKFAKALNGVDDETQKAGKAFAALGLDPNKLRTLDTAEAFKVLADRMNEFRDDSSKTALVLELLGKNGAQLLPYLKDLAETGDLQAKVTAEQAKQAENLEKNLNRLFATKNAGFKEFSAAILPTVDSFVKALLEAANGSNGLREQIKSLTADGSLESWARTAAYSIAFVVDATKNAVNALSVLKESANVLILNAELAYAKVRNSSRDPNVRDLAANRIRKEIEAANDVLGQRTAEFLQAPQFRAALEAQFAKDDAKRASGLKEAPKASVNFTAGKEAAEKFKDELKAVQAFVDQIGERLVGATQGEFEQLRQRSIDVFSKVDYSKLNTEQFDKFVGKLALVNDQIDELEQRSANAAIAKSLVEGLKALEASAEKADDALRNFNQAQSQAAQDLEFELKLVGELSASRQKLSSIRRIDLEAQRSIAAIPAEAENRDERIANITALAEQSKQRTTELFDSIRQRSRDTFIGLSSAAEEYFDRVTNGAENARTAFFNAFNSMEDVLVRFVQTGKLDFKSFVDSVVADIARIQIRQNITAPLAKIIGGMDFGGGIKNPEGMDFFVQSPASPWDSFKSMLGFANGGRPPVGVPSMVGERGPEMFIPDVAGTIVPNGAMGGGVVINQSINVDARSDRASILMAMAQAKEAAKAEILDSMARGGSFAR